MVGSSRQFGGRLTQEAGTSVQNQSILSADAPEFHPGQTHQPRSNNIRGGKTAQSNNHQGHTKAPRARRQSLLKSTAPDIATRTHEDIASGIYECPICTNEVARNSKVWSCEKKAAERQATKRKLRPLGASRIIDEGFEAEHICTRSCGREGNTKKTLSCDDECARLARNQRLAQALNIDPEAHKDDHIPYSNDTLKIFRENIKWAQAQEREFRVFAADETEKRLRFKPMPVHQRAFIHALSEDFGLDSESMDLEPHRHVAIFKTPRFVMAPMKTLAECVRIRTAAEASSATVAGTQKKLQANNEIYNGFLLTNPRFGLTLEELRADFASSLDSTPGLTYEISFLPSEEIVIKARPVSSSTVISSSAIEASLKALKPSLTASTSSKSLAASIQLCALDTSLNILRCELDDPANNGGWSQVAAKAAAPRTLPRQTGVGQKSVYTVLGSKLRDAKKKRDEEKKARENEVVVDDWEEEMRREEEQEEKAKAEAQSEVKALDGIKEDAKAVDMADVVKENPEINSSVDVK
ncbi:hypothetical protein OEA41_004278 [Lepraria neglecta]|uniref:R3H domain-containing protein n=1 Tax=Lepraria neglecta TaxID=209136 RepID=A0AAE0DEC5_9LECA|nr:hypothetical protein OEA41_004278 [Lepraria neglecta]